MPRRPSGPKLWFDKKRGSWTIIDGRQRHRTGFSAAEAGKAEEALGNYIASKYTVKDSATPLLSDVLAAYAEEHLVDKMSERAILYDIAHLTKWWGKMVVTEVNASNCRAYAKHRKVGPSARRELLFLNAAIKHWHREHGPLKYIPVLVLPPAPAPRTHWMTRSQAAAFLWHARKTPHLARFFIIGWYTGSRRGVITGLKWSMVNLDSGIMQRKAPGEVQAANKKSPPVRMGARLMAHLRRWKRLDAVEDGYIVNFRGQKIFRPVSTWQAARIAAGLPDYITPHILRHTRATNMMQQGKDPWEASKALGMSLGMLERTYGHHHPDWQKSVSDTR